jgi:hypothetical protein
MKPRRVPVQTFFEHAMCDQLECDGELRFTGTSYPTSPMQYVHKCNKCSHVETLDNMYPQKVHVVQK